MTLVTASWLEEPHIAQMTLQGAFRLDDITDGWQAVGALHATHPAHPFCLLVIIMPNRELPVGLLSLAQHPATAVFREIDAVAVIGMDHFLIGMLGEMIAGLPYGPQMRTFETYNDGLRYLHQYINAAQAGL
ncbi:MAG: hypothetical protein ACLFTK_13335 [Anaerolineales bacterium]